MLTAFPVHDGSFTIDPLAVRIVRAETKQQI
jgi:hypothetical protein